MKFILSPFSLDCIDDPFSATFFIIASEKDEIGTQKQQCLLEALTAIISRHKNSEIMDPKMDKRTQKWFRVRSLKKEYAAK